MYALFHLFDSGLFLFCGKPRVSCHCCPVDSSLSVVILDPYAERNAVYGCFQPHIVIDVERVRAGVG